MESRRDEFTFIIRFARGAGDPRRIFDAASLLIDGFQELDETIVQVIDGKMRSSMVLEDIRPGSIRVILKTLIGDIDEQALKDGEWKKAIGPVLVRGKRLAIQALDNDEENAAKAVEELKGELQQLAAKTDIKHLPAYAPIHEGRLIASLDKIQDAKRTLGPNDQLTIETEGKVYEVNLLKTWTPDEVIPVSDASEKHSEGVVILTIRKPDLLGNAKWQFAHGTATVNASIKDDRWLSRFHARKIALHSGDALKCKVRFTYVFDTTGKMIEQKTDILKVLGIIRGPGPQDDFFEE